MSKDPFKVEYSKGTEPRYLFDKDHSFNALRREYRNLFKKGLPSNLKKEVNDLKTLWKSPDDFELFKIHAADPLKWGRCIKCGGKYTTARARKIKKMVETQKFVRCESNRTIQCMDCSFSFSALGWTGYANTKLDLRTTLFAQCIGCGKKEDSKYKVDFIDWPIPALARILNVSYGTAKKVKKFAFELYRPLESGKRFEAIRRKAKEMDEGGKNYDSVTVHIDWFERMTLAKKAKSP